MWSRKAGCSTNQLAEHPSSAKNNGNKTGSQMKRSTIG
jgi:hypothetical protein